MLCGRIFTINCIMNISNFSGITAITLIGASLLLVSCGDPQKEARKGLDAKGYEMSVKDLLVAASAGDVDSIVLFNAAGIEIDSTDASGNTALIKAAGAGHIQAVEKILGLGADPRHINTLGRDALISASAKGFEEVSRMLLNRGADTTIKDSEGWGALSIAAYNGHAGVVSLLSSNATSAELDDALLVASFSGGAKVINTLLGQGANINARSPESKTPLMIASQAGKIDAVRVLLQNQANPYAVDLENQTAATLAQSAGFLEVTNLITSPNSWGTSEEGLVVVGEMAKAQQALAGTGVDETLLKDQTQPVGENPITVASTESRVAESGAKVAVRDEAGISMPASKVVGSDRKEATSSLVIRNPKIQASRRLREESRSKPIVALNGSTIHSRAPEEAPVKTMVLAAYHEESLPILVEHVDGSTASVRRLDQPPGPSLVVEKGGTIPGTSYKVEEVTTRFVSSKEGKGRMVDVSRVKVEDTERGSTHVLVKDVSGQTSDTYAILTVPNSQYRYVVKAGDVFRTTQPDTGARDYQVLDIRATGVVIKDLATEEVVTVARDGAIAP